MKENDINICEKCLGFSKCKGYLFGVKCENNALFIPSNKNPKRNKRIQDRIKKLPKDFKIKIIPTKYGVLLKRIIQNKKISK